MNLRALLTFPARTTRPNWRDHAVGALIATVYVAWLLATARSLGFARDEGFYFHAATDYARWFRMLAEHPKDAIQQGAVDGIWNENHEHPSLMKSLFAFSWMLLHEKWHVFEDASTAFRFPGMLMMGLALWVTYLFGAGAYSRRAGVIAAVLLGLMPRVFYNAHLACFDVPIMAMWTWCIYVYWRAQQEGGLGWAIATGMAYGLTLDTKHNAWILPAVLVPHAFWLQRKHLASEMKAGRLSIPAPLVAMVTIGPLVFYYSWPWIWNDTLPRLQEYFEFHFHHVYYNMEFLHVNYWNAPSPRGYMPVMILATVPAITLLLFLVGAGLRIRIHWARLHAWALRTFKNGDVTVAAPDAVETDLLFALAFGAAIAPWLLSTKTPIFGGTKHWFTGYPFLVLFAGYAFDRVASALEKALPEKLASNPRAVLGAQAGLVASVVLAPLAVTAHSHPFGLSAYTPLVGGTAGGADLGLNRQFWGFTTESLEPWFEGHAPRNATVYFHDTAWDSWQRMLAEKRIRPDLRGVGNPHEADISICHLELHMMDVETKFWPIYGTACPTYVLTHDGVPIITVFQRK